MTDILKNGLEAITTATSAKALEDVRVQYLGKSGLLTAELKNLGSMAPEERKARGAEVNAKSAAGVTPLMVAAGHNNAPMIGLLLAKGADPALKNNLGKTALDIAREARNEVAVTALQLLAVPAQN